MTYDSYRYIFIIAAILCGIMLIVSVLVFIFLKIPKVISDLSGATARKAIKKIREQNEATGDKGYKVSAFNEARGKITDKISPSGKVNHQHQGQMAGINTTKISTQKLQEENATEQTTVLDVRNETTVLDNEGSGETTVLSMAVVPDETTVLNEKIYDSVFTVEFEITYIHTNEIILMETIG